jgi:hypothetical protein
LLVVVAVLGLLVAAEVLVDCYTQPLLLWLETRLTQ